MLLRMIRMEQLLFTDLTLDLRLRESFRLIGADSEK